MLGWHISVYRLMDEPLREIRTDAAALRVQLAGDSDRTFDPSASGERMAVWQTRPWAWLD